MQSKFIKISELKSKFGTNFIVDNINDIYDFKNSDFENGVFPVVELEEVLNCVDYWREDCFSKSLNDHINQYKSVLKSAISNQIDLIQNKFLTLEYSLKYRLTSFIHKNKDYDNLKTKFSNLKNVRDGLENNSSIIIPKVKLLDDEDLVKVPYTSFKEDQILYLVATDYAMNLKIDPYIVRKVNLSKSNDTNFDYYFDYIIENLNNPLDKFVLDHEKVNTFDGIKMKTGLYEQSMFIEKQQATDHILKVLTNMKDSIDEQINKIRNF